MFNGNRDGEQEEGAEDEYFDDAGDIGYLPADHVSFTFLMFMINIATHDPTSKCFDKATDRRTRTCGSSTQRERRGS